MRPVKLVWISGPVFPGDHVMRPPVPGRKGPGRFYNPCGHDFAEKEVPFGEWIAGRVAEGAVVIGDSKDEAERNRAAARKEAVAKDVDGSRAVKVGALVEASKRKAARSGVKPVDAPVVVDEIKSKKGEKQ